jgi:hypothetical protein
MAENPPGRVASRYSDRPPAGLSEWLDGTYETTDALCAAIRQCQQIQTARADQASQRVRSAVRRRTERDEPPPAYAGAA